LHVRIGLESGAEVERVDDGAGVLDVVTVGQHPTVTHERLERLVGAAR
jgi:hypothetical protein